MPKGKRRRAELKVVLDDLPPTPNRKMDRVALPALERLRPELGGHFLLATQVISRVREALLIEAPVCNICEGPTEVSLALPITQTQAT